MHKALYGTRSGGACWHDKHFGILQQIDFKPFIADPDICMILSTDGTHYEYIAVCVDDLAICMQEPQAFCDTVKEKYKLKLKGVIPISYHLYCGYTRDLEPLLPIHENMLAKSLSPMKKCVEKNQRRLEHH